MRGALLVVLLLAFAGSVLSESEETTDGEDTTTTTTPAVLPDPTRPSAGEETAPTPFGNRQGDGSLRLLEVGDKVTDLFGCWKSESVLPLSETTKEIDATNPVVLPHPTRPSAVEEALGIQFHSGWDNSPV